MSTLPKGWELARLGSIAAIIRGLAFASADKRFAPAECLIACLRTTNVQSTVEWDDLWFIPRKYVRHEHQLVRVGDILISTANSYDLVGKVAPVRSLDFPATLGAFISLIRPDPLLKSEFVYYQLASSEVQNAIRSLASTTTNISNVSTSKLGDIELRVCPHAEQDRIVAEIEKQFTRLDDAVAALKRVQTNLKRYRTSVLKAACEGRLVPTEAELARKEKRDYEPASELLKRILVERRAKWEAAHPGKKYKEPRVSDSSKLSVPEGWTWAAIDQLSVLVRNGISQKPIGSDGLPILRISAVRPLQVMLSDVRFLPSRAEFENYSLEEDDLLFTRYNGNRDYVGVCGRVRKLDGKVVHPDKIIRVVPVNRLLSGWIEIAVNVGYSRAHLATKIRTTAGQSGVSGGDIKGVPIPLPPQGEQHRIVAEVERRLSGLTAIEAEIERGLVRAARFRHAILASAFAGTLVPQDPADEPASMLLDRIRSTHASFRNTRQSSKITPGPVAVEA